jgi:Tol biopolymer transport system component/uncharacterized protein YraI
MLSVLGRTVNGAWIEVRNTEITGWVTVDELVIFGVDRLPVTSTSDAAPAVAATETVIATATVSATPTVTTTSTLSETAVSTAAEPAVQPTATATTVADTITGVVNLSNSRLNVRSGPATSYSIVAKATPGDTLTLIGRNASSDWAQVNTATGATGWVAARYLTLNGELATLPVAATTAAPATVETPTVQTVATTASETTATTGAASPATIATGGATGLSGTLVIQSSPGGMIYAYNLASGALWALTNGFDPAISPDGQTVAFAREGGENGIYLINIDGSNERLIFSGRTRLSSPKWSPDGKWILFTRSDEYSECIDTGRGCVSVNTLPPGASTDDLTLSKDYEYNLAAVDPNGDHYHDIAALESARVADWNTAGIVYQSSAGLQITSDTADATNRLLRFIPLQPPDEDPDWQPGGNQVLFVQHHGSHYEIFTIGADGSGVTALTRPATTLVDQMPNNVAPAWSPDGRHIVFLSNRQDTSNEAGAWRVWVMDADGGNQRPLPIDLTINYTYGNEQAVDWGR